MASRENEKPLRQRRSTFSRPISRLDKAADVAAMIRHTPQSRIEVANDELQQIIEVVGYTACETPTASIFCA